MSCPLISQSNLNLFILVSLFTKIIGFRENWFRIQVFAVINAMFYVQ